MMIKNLLDCDFYKFTMQQAIFHNYNQNKAKFRFICRNKEVDLSPYVDEIKSEIENLCTLKFSEDDIVFLQKQNLFKEDYLSFLRDFQLNFSDINISKVKNGLLIETEGYWKDVTMFEIFTLSIVNEVYFKNTQPTANKKIALTKLQEKIFLIKEVNQKAKANGKQLFKLIDFGTRRRFSGDWQLEVNQILNAELGTESFIGTSSVYIAKQVGIKPIGTFAHEWLQGHQVVTDHLIDSQKQALLVWIKEYEGKLGIALSDIYGTKPFLKDFTKDLAQVYQGARHDSGDPFKWGEELITHYTNFNIDPKTKTLVFSDGLDVPKAIALYNHFSDRINVVFGIGTNLTNDFGFKTLNIVMKMVSCNGLPVAKISEEPSKAICDDPVFLQLLKQTFEIEI